MKESINTVRHLPMAGLDKGVVLTWPTDIESSLRTPHVSVQDVLCCIQKNRLVSIKLRMSDGATSPLFGTEEPNQVWQLPQ